MKIKELGGAFKNCTALNEVILPSTLTSIGEQTFNRCTSLSSITFAHTEGWYVDKEFTQSVGACIAA